jgi:hypothetical protein
MQAPVAVVVIVAFLTVGCAEVMTQPGQASLLCGAGGAAVGAAIGGAASRDWTGTLIGAVAGALVGAATCFAIAEYRSQQVKGYQETRQAINYSPAQGDALQITHYAIAPAAAAPGSEVAFSATYHVMTADPDADVPVTEMRILKAYDPATSGYRELGRVPNQVTVKPGTRQADGKFDVRSGVAAGTYQVIFQVAKNGLADAKELVLTVTSDPAVLTAPSSRGAKLGVAGVKVPEGTPAPATPLATLGERQPQAPVPAPLEKERERGPVRYFVASKVAGVGNLREGPSARHRIVGQIRTGEKFPIVDRTTHPGEETPWYRIRLENGLEVWVAGSLGTEIEE